MKLRKIALACAALAAAPAFALTNAQLSGATELWMTGASAPTNNVFQGAMSLCAGVKYKNKAGAVITNPGTRDIHIYLQSTGSSALFPGQGSGNSVAYACEIDTDDDRAGALENTVVVIYHTVEGGSLNAYSPALKAVGDTNSDLPATLPRIQKVSTLGATGKCAAGGGTVVDMVISGESNPTGVKRFTGCGNATTGLATVTLGASPTVAPADGGPVHSIGGYSDTEYKINQANLAIGTDLSAIGGEAPTGVAQGFGLAVSFPLYYQLQISTFGASSTCVTTGSAASPVMTGACQPNISSAKYTNLVAENLVPFADASMFGAASLPGSGQIAVHRRVPTSGTQSSSNLFFLNKPCAQGPLQGELALQGAGTVGNVRTVAHSGSGNVRDAVIASSAAGEFGLGWLSLENARSGSAAWAFVKLNGVSPTFLNDGSADPLQRENAITGAYTAVNDLVSFTATTDAPVSAPAGGADFITAVNASLGNPNITNLRGLFVASATRGGNSCAPLQ
jgi:hypothetical protein